MQSKTAISSHYRRLWFYPLTVFTLHSELNVSKTTLSGYELIYIGETFHYLVSTWKYLALNCVLISLNFLLGSFLLKN